MNIFKKEELTSLVSLDKISSVYVGKPDICMCGCAGTYFYTSKNVAWSSKDRGYKVTSDEVNNVKVKRVLNKIMKNVQDGVEVQDNYILTLILGKRQYTIYLMN